MLTELSAELRARNEHTAGAGVRIAERIRQGERTANGRRGTGKRAGCWSPDLTEGVFETVANCPWPMMVMLEDLHWADDLTLEGAGPAQPAGPVAADPAGRHLPAATSCIRGCRCGCGRTRLLNQAATPRRCGCAG